MNRYLLLFIAAASCQVSPGQCYDGGFAKLDNLLANSLGYNEDVKSNIEKARELLKTEGKKMFNGDLVKAIKLFTSLSEAECDAKGYKIMLSNDEATDRVARSRLTSLRRIDRVLLNHAIKHAANCQSIYLVRLDAKLRSMDKELVSKVNIFTDRIIEATKPLLGSYSVTEYSILAAFNDKNQEAIWTKKNMDSFATVTLEAIELAGGVDEDAIFTKPVADDKGSRSVNKEKLNNLFKKYVIEPCKYYCDQLETDIFAPAAYDSEVYSNYEETFENLKWFTLWYKFRTCKRVTRYASGSLFDAVFSNAKRRR